jgi:hypothetical protein
MTNGKVMKLKIISLSLLIIAILFSCRKDNLVITEKTDVPLLSKVQIADQPFYEYLYNGAYLVSEEKSKYNFTVHQYNDMNQLTGTDYYSDNALLSNDLQVIENALNRKGLINSGNSEKGGTVKYEYNNNGQLINTIFSLPSISNSEYSEFSYDANGRISRQTIFWDNKVLGYIDYLYDGSDNLIKETLYSVTSAGVPELSTTTQYEFDNHHNPFKSFYRLMTPGINTNRNNIIKETLTIHFKAGEGTDKVQITSNSYTYDTKGYPIRKNGTVEYLYE